MNGREPRVLVTGANGFVGRHLAPVLAQEGWFVRRAVRRTSGREDEVPIHSIDAGTNWYNALAGVDAVIHLAARVHHPGEEHQGNLYRSVNTEGTLQLARSAAEMGVKDFIFLSTILVNGGCTDGRSPFIENDCPAPRGVYGISKAQAEASLQAVAKSSAMKITVVRPPLVYGPAAAGNFRSLVSAIRYGVPLPLASISNRRAFISVQNLVSFISNRLSFADASFETFLVADREQVSTPEFVARIASAMDKRAKLFPMPMIGLEALLRLTRGNNARDSLVGSMEVDTSKSAASGWSPPLTMDEGLRIAVQSSAKSDIA